MFAPDPVSDNPKMAANWDLERTQGARQGNQTEPLSNSSDRRVEQTRVTKLHHFEYSIACINTEKTIKTITKQPQKYHTPSQDERKQCCVIAWTRRF